MPSSPECEDGRGLCCVIPALNAQEMIAMLVLRIRQLFPSAAVVVVDDGSSDDSAGTAQSAGATVVRHGRNRGKGAALRTGFQVALEHPETDRVATLDADFQHRPEDLCALLACMDGTHADIVIGARRRLGSGMPFSRILSNTITSALVGARTGLEIRDSQCGFRLIRRAVLERIETTWDGYEAETEFLLKAARAGFRIEFVPVKTIYTDQPSHMTHCTTTVNFIRVLFREY